MDPYKTTETLVLNPSNLPNSCCNWGEFSQHRITCVLVQPSSRIHKHNKHQQLQFAICDWHFRQTPTSPLHWRIDTTLIAFTSGHSPPSQASCLAVLRENILKIPMASSVSHCPTSISLETSQWQRSNWVTSSSSANSWLAGSGFCGASSSGLKRLLGSPQSHGFPIKIPCCLDLKSLVFDGVWWTKSSTRDVKFPVCQ